MSTHTTDGVSGENVGANHFELESIPMPIEDRILVQRDLAISKTDGGIIIPDVAITKPKRGRVLATGPGRMLENGTRGEMEIGVGDHVWFSSYAGTDLNGLEDECGFVVMRVGDVLCVDQND
jgi:chaperonin GroES